MKMLRNYQLHGIKLFRACLKNHSRNLHAPLCGIFCPNSVAVARYGALIRAKSPTNCDAHLAESLFQTCSSLLPRTYNALPERFRFSDNFFPEHVKKRLSARCASQFAEAFTRIRAQQRAAAAEFGWNIPQSGACRLLKWFFKQALAHLADC